MYRVPVRRIRLGCDCDAAFREFLPAVCDRTVGVDCYGAVGVGCGCGRGIVAGAEGFYRSPS
jgi:hypothetical protein